jgi:DNA-binding transcriptional LysR family regulator
VDLERLRYFAVTAAEGRFHRASIKLCIAQPALSRQIRDFEHDIGAKPFLRSSQGVKLSRADEVLLAQVERQLPQFELAKSAALTPMGNASRESKAIHQLIERLVEPMALEENAWKT